MAVRNEKLEQGIALIRAAFEEHGTNLRTEIEAEFKEKLATLFTSAAPPKQPSLPIQPVSLAEVEQSDTVKPAPGFVIRAVRGVLRQATSPLTSPEIAVLAGVKQNSARMALKRLAETNETVEDADGRWRLGTAELTGGASH